MTQPPHSGAPVPVQGVTGGPPVLGGQIANDPNSGNVVINPSPGNAVEIKKSPSAFNVYEYFNSNTDNVRLTMATQLGGPEQMGIVAAPPGVTRDLNITASGNGHVLIPALQLATGAVSSSAGVSLPLGVWTDLTNTNLTVVAGVFIILMEFGFVIGASQVSAVTGRLADAGGSPILNQLITPTGPPNQTFIVTSNYVFALAAGTYHLQAYANTLPVTAVGRWSYAKVG